VFLTRETEAAGTGLHLAAEVYRHHQGRAVYFGDKTLMALTTPRV
jgi:hypothetical protein